MQLLPENMGYYDPAQGIGPMLQRSASIKNLPDAFVSCEYHAYLPPEQLPNLIEQISGQGYTFFDLRQQDIQVQSEEIRIKGEHGNFQIQISPSLQEKWNQPPAGKSLMEKIGAVHVTILLLAAAAFFYMIFRLRLTAHKKYELNTSQQKLKESKVKKP